VTSGNKPDLRVKLFFKEDEDGSDTKELKSEDIDGLELVFGEFSRLDAKKKKHTDDHKKLLRFCKDAKKVSTKYFWRDFCRKVRRYKCQSWTHSMVCSKKLTKFLKQIPLEISSREMVE
jgi:hypothetical protein